MKIEKKDVKMCFSDNRSKHICMTVRLQAESQPDTVSITNVVERLDIETMLQRAQQGILDLRTLQRPMVADAVGAGGTPEEMDAANMRTAMSLLEQPDTPANRIFGVDKETATKALNDLQHLADQYKVTKPVEPQPESGKDVKDEPLTPQGDPA